MKVLVTGATGFLGTKVALRLQNEGNKVTGLGRNARVGKELESKGIHFEQVDLLDLDALKKSMAGHDYVIHCAALSSPWGKYEEFFQANVLGTRNVLLAAKDASVKRVVHVSTPSIYVSHAHRTNVREDDPLPDQAINFYSQTKLMGEAEVDLAVKSGLSVITLRPQGIVGPGDTSILPRLIRMAKKGILPVIGDRNNIIDLTYVDNVVEALILAMKAPDSLNGRKYNITNGEPVCLSDTLEIIFKKLGYSYKIKQLSFKKAYLIAKAMEFTCRNFLTHVEPILTCYSVCVLGMSRTLNIEAAQQDLGYKPKVNMNEAIESIVQGYRVRECQ